MIDKAHEVDYAQDSAVIENCDLHWPWTVLWGRRNKEEEEMQSSCHPITHQYRQ